MVASVLKIGGSGKTTVCVTNLSKFKKMYILRQKITASHASKI
jgi:hypothetical protein